MLAASRCQGFSPQKIPSIKDSCSPDHSNDPSYFSPHFAFSVWLRIAKHVAECPTLNMKTHAKKNYAASDSHFRVDQKRAVLAGTLQIAMYSRFRSSTRTHASVRSSFSFFLFFFLLFCSTAKLSGGGKRRAYPPWLRSCRIAVPTSRADQQS